MYECYKENIVDGKESFSVLWIISENILYWGMWVIAGYLLYPVWMPLNLPILSIVWAILVITIQILLKKHNCSGCYYYDKLCHLGWGKISSALFKQNSGNYQTGMKLSFFYILSPPVIFLTALIFAITKNASGSYWFIFAIFLVLNFISFPIRKKGCNLCAMREVCPGSAVKNSKS